MLSAQKQDVQSKGKHTLRTAVTRLEQGNRQVYTPRSEQTTKAESNKGNLDTKW